MRLLPLVRRWWALGVPLTLIIGLRRCFLSACCIATTASSKLPFSIERGTRLEERRDLVAADGAEAPIGREGPKAGASSNGRIEFNNGDIRMNIHDLKSKRFKFLSELYNATAGDENNHVNMRDIGQSLGIDLEETNRITQYLFGESLLKHQGIGGIIGITHQGVREIENALSNPDRPTDRFASVDSILDFSRKSAGVPRKYDPPGGESSAASNESAPAPHPSTFSRLHLAPPLSCTTPNDQERTGETRQLPPPAIPSPSSIGVASAFELSDIKKARRGRRAATIEPRPERKPRETVPDPKPQDLHAAKARLSEMRKQKRLSVTEVIELYGIKGLTASRFVASSKFVQRPGAGACRHWQLPYERERSAPDRRTGQFKSVRTWTAAEVLKAVDGLLTRPSPGA